MQDQIGHLPACFSLSSSDDPSTLVTRPGQSKFVSVYRTRIDNQSRLVTITWCKNAMIHGLSVTLEEGEEFELDGGEKKKKKKEYQTCKVELKPGYFWRKQGSKQFVVQEQGTNKSIIEIYWDLKNVKFNGETEPPCSSDYYVAVVCNEEVVLLVGDMKKDAYRKTGCRPSLVDPVLVSRKEHIFGKKKYIFSRTKFHEKGRFHEISVECKNKAANASNDGIIIEEPELEIRIDGKLFVHVKHLQWKFRGNESIHLNKVRLEVYWDVHDWLFSPGLRHALFIFKPTILLSSSTSSLASTPLSSQTASSTTSSSFEGSGGFNGLSEFSLFLYAWRVE